jgi:hypothetical protein
MSQVINRADRAMRFETYWDMDMEDNYDFDASEPSESPDASLIRAYLQKSKGLHVRRTLDQWRYSMLSSTEERDMDQILSKYGKDKSSPKVVMVDQLWLWMSNGMFPIKYFLQRSMATLRFI